MMERAKGIVLSCPARPARANDCPSAIQPKSLARRVRKAGITKPLNFTPLAKSMVDDFGLEFQTDVISSIMFGLKFKRTPYSLNSISWPRAAEPPFCTTGTGNRRRRGSCLLAIHGNQVWLSQFAKGAWVRSTRSIADVLICLLKRNRLSAGESTLPARWTLHWSWPGSASWASATVDITSRAAWRCDETRFRNPAVCAIHFRHS